MRGLSPDRRSIFRWKGSKSLQTMLKNWPWVQVMSPRVVYKSFLTWWRFGRAMTKRVSGETRTARATRQVIGDSAIGVLTASAGTRVFTFVSDAGFVWGAVRVQNALRPTSFVRISNVIFNARTRSGPILFATQGVRAARRRSAWSRSFLDRLR